MIMMNDPDEYIVHDYTAINQQIEEIQRRESQISESMKVENERKNRINSTKKIIENVILLCGLGAFAVLFAYAIRLVVYSPVS